LRVVSRAISASRPHGDFRVATLLAPFFLALFFLALFFLALFFLALF